MNKYFTFHISYGFHFIYISHNVDHALNKALGSSCSAGVLTRIRCSWSFLSRTKSNSMLMNNLSSKVAMVFDIIVKDLTESSDDQTHDLDMLCIYKTGSLKTLACLRLDFIHCNKPKPSALTLRHGGSESILLG